MRCIAPRVNNFFYSQDCGKESDEIQNMDDDIYLLYSFLLIVFSHSYSTGVPFLIPARDALHLHVQRKPTIAEFWTLQISNHSSAGGYAQILVDVTLNIARVFTRGFDCPWRTAPDHQGTYFLVCHVNVVSSSGTNLIVDNNINNASNVEVLHSTNHTTPITRVMVVPR